MFFPHRWLHTYVGLAASFLGGLFFFGFLPVGASHTPFCHVFTPNTILPERFGLPYDPAMNMKQMLMQATCTDKVATVTFGSNSASQYIYHQGWRYDTDHWVPITLTSRERCSRTTHLAD